MNCIVITSIFPPTRAVQDFARRSDWQLIVAGDRKTPADWRHENVRFLSATAQEERGFRLSTALPWNHYCRKMTGYLEAMRIGAEQIVDTDDDNIPKENWSFPESDGAFETTAVDLGFVNVYRAFTDMPIWPRGFPLERIHAPESRALAGESQQVKVGIWQGLADGDPDVDAIYRLTNNEPCYFAERAPLVLGRGTWCPFNSQNTLFVRELFPLLYLPAFVTFRFTDILRGLVAQPIAWAAGYHLGFTSATVVQERNPHDYLKDFESEIPCYLLSQKVADTVSGAVRETASVSENLHAAYEALLVAGVVKDEELRVLNAWLEDLRQ
ncbi:MAG: STELLO glycosyltransferase family protein [Verrucomicrobiota bacterium]|nr:STELLO glycosyltransferase family protein [Verrucomicrobiota bacterium]